MADQLPSEFMKYLANNAGRAGERLPSIPDLAEHLGISIGKLREQLEVARVLGLVEVRPKTGIRTNAYSFSSSLRPSLMFALAVNPDYFEHYGVLRNHIEACFWHEAVAMLKPEDIKHLQKLVDTAWSKLQGDPIQIPHEEHRELHLRIFARLENPFVIGLLEAYWEGYEAVGLNVYAGYAYLVEVWDYHQRMVQAIVDGEYDEGYQALVEHTGLLQKLSELARKASAADSSKVSIQGVRGTE
jgi:DNA-binding FadR family transcriptional regulator